MGNVIALFTKIDKLFEIEPTTGQVEALLEYCGLNVFKMIIYLYLSDVFILY